MTVAQLKNKTGFTIVELLIVVVVIAILAAITIVAFNGIQQRAQASSAKSASVQAYKKLEAYRVDNSAYPASLSAIQINDTSTTTFTYLLVDGGSSACVSAQTGSAIYSSQNSSSPIQGGCGQVVASYYPNITLSGEPALHRSEVAMSNSWGASAPDALVPSDNFSAQWKSKITPPVTGTYTFYTNTDDSAELSVNNIIVIGWTAAGIRDATSTTVELTANQPVPVIYSMVEIGGNAYATLAWSYPGQARTTVPSSAYSRM